MITGPWDFWWLEIVIFQHIGLTQTIRGAVGANICHGSNIDRITSSLAICLQNQKMFSSCNALYWAEMQSFYFQKLWTVVCRLCRLPNRPLKYLTCKVWEKTARTDQKILNIFKYGKTLNSNWANSVSFIEENRIQLIVEAQLHST